MTKVVSRRNALLTSATAFSVAFTRQNAFGGNAGIGGTGNPTFITGSGLGGTGVYGLVEAFGSILTVG